MLDLLTPFLHLVTLGDTWGVWCGVVQGCGKQYTKRKRNEHNDECPMYTVDCELEPHGCKHRCLRSAMEEHMKASLVKHTELLSDKLYRLSDDMDSGMDRMKRDVRDLEKDTGPMREQVRGEHLLTPTPHNATKRTSEGILNNP